MKDEDGLQSQNDLEMKSENQISEVKNEKVIFHQNNQDIHLWIQSFQDCV
jgi:hypothetical protein